MNRREFLHLTGAASLAAQGFLPLLAANHEGTSRQRTPRKPSRGGAGNIFTEPPAIEPVTGYLTKFHPAAKGTMIGAFAAKYTLIACHGSKAKSINSIKGSIDVAFSDATCKTTEVRKTRPENILKTELTCQGEFNTVRSWTLDSSVRGFRDLHFVEKGVWDGKAMIVKSKSWTQQRSTANPLIGRWALLPLLASGKLKAKPLTFDLLDDSTLRPDQILRYAGKVEIPLAGGSAKLDCYSQIGRSIVPTHYLVDDAGRVQLITMASVNWVLSGLKSTGAGTTS